MWFIFGTWTEGYMLSLRWEEKWDSGVIARAGVSPLLVNDWNAVPFPLSTEYLEVMFGDVGCMEDRWNFVPKGLLESYWSLTFFIQSSHQPYKVGDFIPFNLLMKLEHRELISPRTGRWKRPTWIWTWPLPPVILNTELSCLLLGFRGQHNSGLQKAWRRVSPRTCWSLIPCLDDNSQDYQLWWSPPERQGWMSGESRCIFLRDSSASLGRLLLLVSCGESLWLCLSSFQGPWLSIIWLK